jgi:hypothetical protein
VELYENNPTNKVNLSDITKGKKVVIFAVPGAFTPGCSKVSGFSYPVAFPGFLLFHSCMNIMAFWDVCMSFLEKTAAPSSG